MSVITDLIDENSECHRRIAELEARIVWLECEAKVNAAPVVSAEQQGVALSREACVIALRLIHRELETLANGSAIERFKAAKEEFSAMLASAPAAPSPGEHAREHQWQLIHDTLRNYRMGTLSDGEGGGYPLIDAMTADGQSVSGGIEECTYLADALWNALAAAPAAPAADAGIVDMYRHLQKVTPYRFKKIQDASITDGGDVMYFHKDRFDAALLADMATHCAAKGVV